MKLAILGASGHGKIVADAASLSGWEEIFFYDDAWPSIRANGYWPVIGDSKNLLLDSGKFDGFFVAIGDNYIRQEKFFQLEHASLPIVSVVHPAAVISKQSKVGLGTFIAAGAIVNIDANIGDFSVINTAAVIEHDCYLGAACHISPSASLAGGVVVGARSWVGINATVRQLVKIGDDVIIGAGSVVVNDVQSGTTVVGNPARILSK